MPQNYGLFYNSETQRTFEIIMEITAANTNMSNIDSYVINTESFADIDVANR